MHENSQIENHVAVGHSGKEFADCVTAMSSPTNKCTALRLLDKMGCDIYHLYSVWMEAVHKSEGEVHREVSGAGDMPQRCPLTSSSKVFQTTNSSSVSCQPVGHLGVRHDTLRLDSTSPLPTSQLFLPHPGRG